MKILRLPFADETTQIDTRIPPGLYRVSVVAIVAVSNVTESPIPAGYPDITFASGVGAVAGMPSFSNLGISELAPNEYRWLYREGVALCELTDPSAIIAIAHGSTYRYDGTLLIHFEEIGT
jgi:hypothetical protein